MTIAKRLIFLLAVPLMALLGLGIFARVQLARIEERSRFVAESRIVALATLGNVSRNFAELRVNMFVTLQCLVFDLEQRRVSCAGAGHHQLAVVAPGRPPRLACPSSGRPAGLLPSNPVERETLSLTPGDTFVLFSDGVSEAMNPEEDFYGEERLLAVLAASSGVTAAETVTRVLADVRAFTAGAKQSDDITVLAAQYAPSLSVPKL